MWIFYLSIEAKLDLSLNEQFQVWTMLMATKSEVQDMQQEHQREMEALLESVRQISSEVKKLSLICDYFIPQEYLQLIQEHTHWNDEIGEWQLVSKQNTRAT